MLSRQKSTKRAPSENLNMMDGDKELSERVQTILFNAEMKVLMELITHYEQLAMKLEISLAKIKNNIKTCREH